MNRLDGKIAFISGAARGIGAATARLMTFEPSAMNRPCSASRCVRSETSVSRV